MKNLINMLFVLFLTVAVKGQGNENEQKWKLYAETDGVKIEYRQSDCHIENSFHQSWYLIRLTNSTSQKVYVNYDMDLYYNNTCTTCGKGEYKFGQRLAPGQVLEGECSFSTASNLKVFIKFLDMKNKSELTDFKLSNIKVTKL